MNESKKKIKNQFIAIHFISNLNYFINMFEMKLKEMQT